MTDPAPSPHDGLIVLQSNRTEDLLELALGWLNRHPLHPLDRTVFLVQSNGIAQWLKISFGERQGRPGRGICLGTDVMLPARFQWEVYRSVIEAVEGPGVVPATSPYDKTRLRWRLLALLPKALGDPRFAPLAHYLREDDEQRRHYQLAERLADLFDQYQVYRADWLNAWEAGRDVLSLPGNREIPVPAEQCWQPALWRMLGDTLGAELASTHRGAVHRRFLAGAARLEKRPPRLPPRVVVFGISSLPQQVLEVLTALSGVSEVVLCLLNPCQHFWGEIIETREVLRYYHRQQRRRGMPENLHLNPESLHLHAHPLLAAWGKQGRDYLQLLAEYDSTDVQAMASLQQPVDWFQPPSTDFLLGQLQDDILELRPLAETRDTWPAVDTERDLSIRFHRCHSPQRELEVLHDQLLAAFADSASLQPRDIMVMVPDINDYAPSIDAVFGQFGREDARHVPYHVADQQQRHRQPMLVALETLLSLPTLRFRASEILDLLDIPPLRQRFGLGESDLPVLQRWIRGANVRWGLDADQRSELDLPRHDDLHSWRFGLARMLMGYAVGEAAENGDDWAAIVPYDEVAGLDAALVGPLYRLILVLDELRQRLQQPQSAADWGDTLRDMLEMTLEPVSAAEQGMLAQIRSALDAWQSEIEEAGVLEPLSLAVVRESWLERIDEPQLSRSFLMGRVTFATLMPMRAIPFRQIYLLGMNDGAYPRRTDAVDFDLMALREHYRAGDRSRRDDDRYLFLEALLSARERLSISWCGRSVKDNSEQPPSVLVGQLRDHLDKGWRLAPGRPAGELLPAITTEHPLQPFGDGYFRADSALFTYAREWQGLRSEDSTQAGPEPESTALPPWWPEVDVTLAQLSGFLRDPVTALFQQRLSTHVRDDDILAQDEEPFAFEGLDKWQQLDALLQPLGQRLAQGEDVDMPDLLARRVEQRQRAGDYPPVPVGPAVRRTLLQPLPVALESYRDCLAAYPGHLPLTPLVRHELTLPWEGAERCLVLEDTLGDLHVSADRETVARIVLLTSSINRGRDRHWMQILKQWPAHLALQLLYPGAATHLISSGGTLVLRGMPEAQAAERLDRLMGRWLQGMQRPAPTHPELAFAALGQFPDPGPDGWHVDSLLADSRLRASWDKSYEQLCERTPLLVREYPTLEALVQAPGFVAASLELYADVCAWVGVVQEEDQ
ncbi:exodeoxyribonuclease V subunit gamma [Chromatocurvus halotolerans]|uniref:RecBCD enzyme subunit RecC n=1 Tax=Chromatocurvus halotolerans TaxID=1132028 RepID=A0A4R2KZ49_9GAMM|nr:exodeoxyribonuclease V subunit gamma [Chromatocurvus halotolerans]TCO76719.1 DNA helicase/exodeoxyribonuclease V gamma subunit [Chromatocurvus halotolerans]